MPARAVVLAFVVAGLVGLAGCAQAGETAAPAASVPSTSHAPPVAPATNLTATEAPAAAKRPALPVSFNGTGDLAVRFLLAAEPGTPCEVEAAVSFAHDAGRENSFTTLEESSGASFRFGGGGTYLRAGPVDTASSSDGDLWAWQSRSSGESWGETHYTVAVRGMTWWPNEFTGASTFRLDASCDGPFEVRDVTASREVRQFSQAGLGGGTAVASNDVTQVGAFVQGEWSADLVGDDIRVVVLNYFDALRMDWSTPAQETSWDGAQQEGGGASILVLEGGAGTYRTVVDAAGRNGFAAVVADLPPVPDLQAYLDSF